MLWWVTVRWVLQLLMQEPGKDESSECYLSFLLLGGKTYCSSLQIIISILVEVRSRNSLLALLQGEFPAWGPPSLPPLELWVQCGTGRVTGVKVHPHLFKCRYFWRDFSPKQGRKPSSLKMLLSNGQLFSLKKKRGEEGLNLLLHGSLFFLRLT